MSGYARSVSKSKRMLNSRHDATSSWWARFTLAMKKLLAIAVLIVLSNMTGASQSIEKYRSFDVFEEEVLQQPAGDTVYLINFWATWCGPCVKELPYFASLPTTIAGRPIKVVLVSLDFERQLDKKFYPWLELHPQPYEVVLLLDPKANTWIDKVDRDWSGAIPFSYIFHGKKSRGFEGSFHSSKEVKDHISTFISTL